MVTIPPSRDDLGAPGEANRRALGADRTSPAIDGRARAQSDPRARFVEPAQARADEPRGTLLACRVDEERFLKGVD